MNSTKQHKFLDLTKEERKFELHVETCVHLAERAMIYDSSRSDFFSIVVVLQGQISFKLNLKDEKASRYSLLVLSPGTIKQLIHKTDDAWFCIVAFTTKFLMQIGVQQYEADILRACLNFIQ